MREDDSWRIAREELLASQQLSAQADREAFPLGRFALAETVGTTVYLLLYANADPSWASGAPTVVSEPDDYLFAARQDPSPSLPAALTAFQGKKVRLFAPDDSCEGQVEAIKLLGVVDTDSSDYLREGRDEAAEPSDEMPPAQVARAVMRLGGPMVVARIDQPCPDALWGQLAASPEPQVLHDLAGMDEDDPLVQRGLSAFYGEQEYVAAQAQWKSDMAGDARAQQPWSEEVLSYQVWGLDAAQVLTVGAFDDSCAGVHPQLFAAYGVRGDIPTLRYKEAAKLRPVMVFDLDLDGRYEILLRDTDTGVYLLAGQHRPTTVSRYVRTTLGCRC